MSILGSIGYWTLVVLVLTFALIGFLQFTRGTSVRHVRSVGADVSPISVSEPQFPLNVSLFTGAALSTGNVVEIALDGDGTYPRLWADLRAATQSITLQLYYGAPGRMAGTLSEILTERARAGVRVLVLYDAFGTVDIPATHRETLRASGVIVQPFRPIRLSTLHLAQNRSHVRGVVIDGRIGWTGGFGIDDKWLGDGRTNEAWRETNARFEGPAVRQLQGAFARSWLEATGEMVTGRVSPEPAPGGVEAALLHTTPSLGTTAAERFFALSFAAARKTLYITNAYFTPERNFIDGLVAAAKRGVDVRLLTSGAHTVQIVRYAGRAWYETLLSAGVRIYEWQPTTLHAKTFVVDGEWSTIGSMNFDNRSLSLNDEATLMVRDGSVGQRMNEIFLDDLKFSEELSLEVFRRRSWYQRAMEWTSGLFRRVL